MLFFKYEANDIAGNRRSGTLTAPSREDARRQLSLQSFTDIALTEQAPPAPPMPLSRKLLIALAVFLALAACGYAAVSKVLAPPDMETVYKQWDEAVKTNDFDAQFKNFEKTIIYFADGKYRKVDRDKARLNLKTRVESQKLIKNRTTTVETVKIDGALCVVPVSVKEFTGKKGTLDSRRESFSKIHVWKREGTEWKIYLVKDIPVIQD